jgi:hypothetical protein
VFEVRRLRKIFGPKAEEKQRKEYTGMGKIAKS